MRASSLGGPLTQLIDGWLLENGANDAEAAKKKTIRWSKRFDLQTRSWTKDGLKSRNPPSPMEGSVGWFTNK